MLISNNFPGGIQMDKFLSNLKEGILIFDKNGAMVYANEYMLKGLNYEICEVEKLGFEDIIVSVNSMADNLFHRYMLLLYKEVELRLQNKEGNVVKYYSCGKIFTFHGEELIAIVLEAENDMNDVHEHIEIIFNQFLVEHKKVEEYSTLDINIKHILKNVVKQIKKTKEIETELELILNTAVDLVAILDKQGNFLKVNSRWKQALGWDEDYLLTINVKDIMHEEDVVKCYMQLNVNNDSPQVLKYRNRYKCKDGSYKWIDWRSRYFPEIGKFVCTATDITENLEMKKKNEDYEKELKLERIRMEFFSNISHELKTPLSIIIATIQLINRNIECNNIHIEESNCFNKYLHSIRQNSYRLVKLVNNIGDMVKIDAGYYDINLENRDIVNVVEDITMSVAQYIENKGTELIFDTNVEELIVAIDPDKIERILLNLISNAIKHTGEQGKIKVDLSAREDEVEISVEDNGIGISKDKINIIFDRFSQVDSDISIRQDGCGIGLSLVQSLVKMHGGAINVESTENVGSRFYFTIPIKVLEEKATKKVTQSSNAKVEKCIIEFSDIYK